MPNLQVILCRDCRHWDVYGYCGALANDTTGMIWMNDAYSDGVKTNAEFFCALGELR